MSFGNIAKLDITTTDSNYRYSGLNVSRTIK